jgi:hypothetical protein
MKNIDNKVIQGVVVAAVAALITFFGFFYLMTYRLADQSSHLESRREVSAKAWIVATLTSEPDEDHDAFLLRVAHYMQRWTDTNNAEVCGYLASDGTRWGVRLTTLKSQLTCISSKQVVPDGMIASGENIHSHPSAGEHGTLSTSMDTKRVARAFREQVGRVIRPSPGFSKDDFDAGPGYLVADGKLSYQAGEGTVRILGETRETSEQLLASQ